MRLDSFVEIDCARAPVSVARACRPVAIDLFRIRFTLQIMIIISCRRYVIESRVAEGNIG